MPDMGNSSHTPRNHDSPGSRPSGAGSEWLKGKSQLGSEPSKLAELRAARDRSRRPVGAMPSNRDERSNLWRSLFGQKSRRSSLPVNGTGRDDRVRRDDTARSPQRKPTRSTAVPVGSRRVSAANVVGKPLESRSRRSGKGNHARPRHRGVAAALYATRMLILSVGIGVLAGTLLSAWDPAHRSQAGISQQAIKSSDGGSASNNANAEASVVIATPKLGQEITSLKSTVQTVALQNTQFTPGVFLFDLDTGAYMDVNGGASFAAASTIKVPILVAFFQDVDAGKISLDERLTMQKELVATGSGEMQYQAPGTQFTALETASKMITISDNTATNMLIARLGGLAALNQRFRSWGLMATALNNMLPDLEGTNMTSPKDLAMLMARISQGELMSIRSRDRMLDIMRKTVNDSQLPQGLGPGATISHKTGDIGSLIGDVGLIDVPNGKRYAIAVLIKRNFNDDRAYDLVRQLSQAAYRYFTTPSNNQNRPASPPMQGASTGEPSPTADTSSTANALQPA